LVTGRCISTRVPTGGRAGTEEALRCHSARTPTSDAFRSRSVQDAHVHGRRAVGRAVGRFESGLRRRPSPSASAADVEAHVSSSMIVAASGGPRLAHRRMLASTESSAGCHWDYVVQFCRVHERIRCTWRAGAWDHTFWPSRFRCMGKARGAQGLLQCMAPHGRCFKVSIVARRAWRAACCWCCMHAACG
jgi:hypothetical protein